MLDAKVFAVKSLYENQKNAFLMGSYKVREERILHPKAGVLLESRTGPSERNVTFHFENINGNWWLNPLRLESLVPKILN
jgi:hypothetical protein